MAPVDHDGVVAPADTLKWGEQPPDGVSPNATASFSKKASAVVPSLPPLVCTRPPDFAGHPTLPRVSALTPRACQASAPLSSRVLTTRSNDSLRSSRRPGNTLSASMAEPPGTATISTEGSKVMEALQLLFNVYDTNSDGYVDFEEFAEGQDFVAAALEQTPNKPGILALFFQANGFFQLRRGARAGLAFEEFAEWQMEIWTETGKSYDDIVYAFRWEAAVLAEAREQQHQERLAKQEAERAAAEALWREEERVREEAAEVVRLEEERLRQEAEEVRLAEEAALEAVRREEEAIRLAEEKLAAEKAEQEALEAAAKAAEEEAEAATKAAEEEEAEAEAAAKKQLKKK